MLKFRENEEAVSPVIGVILMVAITVILAAVIAAFVFGMTDNIQTSKTVGVTATVNADNNLVVTIQGGVDLPALTSIGYQTDEGESTIVWKTPTDIGETAFQVGSRITFTEFTRDPDDPAELTILGEFKDGNRAILAVKTF